MPDTFVKIASVTVGSGGSSTIDFTSIPSTYTDLCIKLSLRDTVTGTNARPFTLKFNGSSTSYSAKFILGDGSAASSFSDTSAYAGYENTSSTTTNTFATNEIYIPNYAGSNYKSASIDSVTETNATQANAALVADLWSNTAAINQVTITSFGTFVQYSTAVLYGIKNS